MLSTKFDSSALQLQIHTWYFKTKTITCKFYVYCQNVLTPRRFYANSKLIALFLTKKKDLLAFTNS